MTSNEKKKLIATNAGIWGISILVSFILPFIADSLSTGPAKFLQMICVTFPLITGMAISSMVISKSIKETGP